MWWKTKFKTKAALTLRIREIAAQPVDQPLNAEDTELMRWVLSHHAGWSSKYDTAEITPRYVWSHGKRTVCFHVGDTHFSWVVALKSNGTCSAKENVAAAARREIAPQIATARNAVVRGSPCPICGEPLLDDLHVDHANPTFDDLLTGFIKRLTNGYESVEIEDVDGIETRFADRRLALDWQLWHFGRANLRVIHAAENLRRSM